MQSSASGHSGREEGGLGGNADVFGGGGGGSKRNGNGNFVNTNGGTHAVVTPFLQPEMIDDGGLSLRSRCRHGGELPTASSTGGAATAAAAAATASASDGAATFASKRSNSFPSDEDDGTDRRATMAHFENGENDSFDSSSFSSNSPEKNYVTPDQSFFPSVSSSSRPIRSNPGSNGSSPSRRALTRPVPSGKTPPRAPATSYTSFLRPRGLQGRVLFAPKGAGVVSVGVPSSESSTGSSPSRQQRPFPVQQLSSSAAQSHQPAQPSRARIHPSIFSERGRKRRAYSANGPFSSSLSNSNASVGAGSGGAVMRVPSSPNQSVCQKTPHPMSPGSIGLEAMSIHSPPRDGLLQQSNNYINEAAAGAPPPPPPSFSPENDGDSDAKHAEMDESANLPPSNRSMEMAPLPTSRRGSSNSSHDFLSGANTPTTMFQTPQTSPRRGGSLCPSSALGSIGGSSVGGGSCFGPYRSRTPSPNPLMLLGGRPCHRRQGSGTSHLSAMSGLSSTFGGGGCGGSGSNPLDTSFDTSTGLSSADIGEDEGKQHQVKENGELSTSSSPLKVQSSPKHVPVLVLTKMADAKDNEDGGAINQEVAGRPKSSGESLRQNSQKDKERTKDLDRLLDVALPSGTARADDQSQGHQAQSTAPLPPSGTASFQPGPSPGGSVRGFNLSPRRPLPASMMSPGGSTGSSMLERSPMIETPAWAIAAAAPESSTTAEASRRQRNVSTQSSPGSFLSPRRTVEDGRLADLLFGEDDPPSPLLSSSRRGNGTTSKADSSKPPPFPSTTQFCANNGDDMGAVMDGLLSGFNRGNGLSGKQRLESSNSLAFSMGSSTNSLDRMKADDGFPIKTLSFGGDQSGTSRYPAGTGTAPRRGSFHTSPPSSSQTTPRRNGTSNGRSQTACMQLPPGFMVRSVLTPSKSGGSLQKLMDAHRARSKGVSALDDGSLSDSCDGSQGPNDMFFLNSPEEVAAATIHAQVESNRAVSAENADDYAGGRAKKRRSTADSKSSHLPTMPMEISETYRGNQDQSPSEETNDGNGELIKKDLPSSSSSSTLESTKLSARQSGRRGGGARGTGNVPKLKKARSVTFSPSPEVSHSMTTMNRAASSAQFGGQRILSQTSSSSLYGMDIVQEEPSPKNCGERAEATVSSELSMSLNATSAVTPRQNTDSTDPYYFAAISSKSRSESGETLSTPSGSHCNLQNLQSHNKRQSFGSSGSLLAHFNNLNRQESDASLNWGVPSYYGVTRRASSRAESALGLPIGHDEDESSATARPPSSAKAYTPPARDLITPPAQTFSMGIGESTSANKCRGMGRRTLSPPPLPSKWHGTDSEEDGQSSEDPFGSQAPSRNHHREGRNEQRRKHLCIAAADKDAVRFAIARMEADNNSNDAS